MQNALTEEIPNNVSVFDELKVLPTNFDYLSLFWEREVWGVGIQLSTVLLMITHTRF